MRSRCSSGGSSRCLLAEARAAIDEDGADTIVLASLTMRTAGEYLRERLEVPVIDPGPLAFALAEMLVELRLTHSKRPYGGRASVRDARVVQR